jgi:hypothetical protein
MVNRDLPIIAELVVGLLFLTMVLAIALPGCYLRHR